MYQCVSKFSHLTIHFHCILGVLKKKVNCACIVHRMISNVSNLLCLIERMVFVKTRFWEQRKHFSRLCNEINSLCGVQIKRCRDRNILSDAWTIIAVRARQQEWLYYSPVCALAPIFFISVWRKYKYKKKPNVIILSGPRVCFWTLSHIPGHHFAQFQPLSHDTKQVRLYFDLLDLT